jgi:Rrf2 family protein
VFQVPTKTQYAIRALVHLVRAKSASVASIAEAQHIPFKYLEAILGQLKTAGLVVADRGRCGGYRLTRAPERVPMSEVVRAMEGEITPVSCLDDASFCIVSEACLPRRFWFGLKRTVDAYLESVTLAEIAEPGFLPASEPSEEESVAVRD